MSPLPRSCTACRIVFSPDVTSGLGLVFCNPCSHRARQAYRDINGHVCVHGGAISAAAQHLGIADVFVEQLAATGWFRPVARSPISARSCELCGTQMQTAAGPHCAMCRRGLSQQAQSRPTGAINPMMSSFRDGWMRTRQDANKSTIRQLP